MPVSQSVSWSHNEVFTFIKLELERHGEGDRATGGRL